MVHLVLGTKAQYIKTAPVIWRLEETGTPYRLIDTGQHAGLAPGIRRELEIRQPDLVLRTGEDLSRLRSGLAWAFRWSFRAVRDPGFLREVLFAGEGGICLVHGDTASAWMGAWLAKRAGLKVAHLEAGLRSFRWLSPFPEEICRLMTSRMADLLLAPSEWAAENLRRMRVRGRIVTLSANTGLEAVRFSLRQPIRLEPPWPEFALATIHRLETLYLRRRLAFVAETLLKAAEVCPVLFLLHEPTQMALARAGLMERLAAHPRIRCRRLVRHHDFVHLIRKARFLITDGGSVQEESFYLDAPCLILRDRSERPEGLIPPGNVCLAEWSRQRVETFLKEPGAYRRRQPVPDGEPSAQVAGALLSMDE